MRRLSLQMSAIKGMIKDVEQLIDDEPLMSENEHANIFKRFGQMVEVILDKTAKERPPATELLTQLLNDDFAKMMHVRSEVLPEPINVDNVLTYKIIVYDTRTGDFIQELKMPLTEAFRMVNKK